MGIQFRNRLLKANAVDRFDVVQAASHRATALGIVHRFPVPVVVRASSYEPMLYAVANVQGKAPTRDQRIVTWLVRYTLLNCRGIYAPSHFLAAGIQSDTGLEVQTIPPPFFLEVPNLDPSRYNEILAGKRYLLYFGTFNRLKGGAILADAAPQILDMHKDLYLVLAGKTSKYDSTQSMLEYLLTKVNPQQERVINLGRLPHTQLYPIVSNALCAVFPSLVDNLPNTLMEAMALGCPAVGTRGTSMDELIEDGVSGVLVNPGSVDELLQGIERLIGMSDEQRKGLGKCAQESISLRLSPDTACLQLEHYYESILR